MRGAGRSESRWPCAGEPLSQATSPLTHLVPGVGDVNSRSRLQVHFGSCYTWRQNRVVVVHPVGFHERVGFKLLGLNHGLGVWRGREETERNRGGEVSGASLDHVLSLL